MAAIKGLIDYGNGPAPLRRAAPVAAEVMRDSPMKRTAEGLRDVLFDEIEALRAGRSDAERAGAIGKLAAHIVAVTRLEMDFAAGGALVGDKALRLGKADDAA